MLAGAANDAHEADVPEGGVDALQCPTALRCEELSKARKGRCETLLTLSHYQAYVILIALWALRATDIMTGTGYPREGEHANGTPKNCIIQLEYGVKTP